VNPPSSAHGLRLGEHQDDRYLNRVQLVDAGPRSVLVLEPERVDLGVFLLTVRHIVLGEDGRDRADRLAGAAVDALIGVDVELAVYVFVVVDAVDGTDLDAGLVDGADTGIRNDVSQGMSPPPTALI
jgi:hypothetical protein